MRGFACGIIHGSEELGVFLPEQHEWIVQVPLKDSVASSSLASGTKPLNYQLPAINNTVSG